MRMFDRSGGLPAIGGAHGGHGFMHAAAHPLQALGMASQPSGVATWAHKACACAMATSRRHPVACAAALAAVGAGLGWFYWRRHRASALPTSVQARKIHDGAARHDEAVGTDDAEPGNAQAD